MAGFKLALIASRSVGALLGGTGCCAVTPPVGCAFDCTDVAKWSNPHECLLSATWSNGNTWIVLNSHTASGLYAAPNFPEAIQVLCVL